MSKSVGTIARGIRTPIIRNGDDLVSIVTEAVLNGVKEENLTLKPRDIVAVTEAVVAKAENNYAT